MISQLGGFSKTIKRTTAARKAENYPLSTSATAQGYRISSRYLDKMSSFRFEHNLTRPYPFKWYTPAVFVGFTIATV